MIGIYFSGTGNTKYCVNKFLEAYGGNALCLNKCPRQAITLLGKK